MHYDVVIVGAGPTGIFASWELAKLAPHKKVLVIERGNDIYTRRCPILMGKMEKCPTDGRTKRSGCKPACSMTSGFGGSGAYSDGKFNITTEFGGWMTDYLPHDEVMELIRYVDEINLSHGAPKELTNPNTEKVREIEKKGIAVGLKLLRSEVRHLGTEVNLQVLKNIYEELRQKIDFLFQTNVTDIVVKEGQIRGVVLESGKVIETDYVLLGVGRAGSEWLSEILRKHGVHLSNNRVDIGVRVETPNLVMDEVNQNLYEGKFIYNTSVGTTVRTFCSNPSGKVVIENHNGVMVCNGHSYHDAKLGSENTNFALLVSHYFDEPFKDANEYARNIADLANKLSGGTVIVQKFGDILKGRRSTKKRIEEGFVRPTLKEAVPGDLSLILPYTTMISLIEMMRALDHVSPGIATDHTLLYGVEAKFYSDQVEVDHHFETKITNLYVGGDGAGLTRGLAQAGANGVKVARSIVEKMEKNV